MTDVLDDAIRVITDGDLTRYLRDEYRDDDVTYLVALTNAAVTEVWSNPVDPVPVTVKAIALEVASRPYLNPRGLSSWTRSGDEISRTERLPDKLARAGVFLTDLERRQLQGGAKQKRRYGTLRTRPGY